MTSQQELFDDLPVRPATPQLAVTPQPGRVLTKAQKAFNRLLLRIEELRRAIKERTTQLENALQAYQRDVRPLVETLTGLKKELARALAPFLNDPRIKRPSDRELLDTLCDNLLNGIAEHEGELVDEDLRAIRADIDRRLASAATDEEKEAFAALRSEVEGMFGAAGLDIDLSDLGPDTSAEELNARVAKAVQAARERAAAADAAPGPATAPEPAPPKRTKKQLEREKREKEAEEARRRTIGAIYKQLAKVLHPDLEPDPEKRGEKLALMQQLTVAYRNEDLPTLLRLELEWLHREEGDLDRLTEEKLKIYNTVLREQADGLQQELAALGWHPRFSVLAEDHGFLGTRLDLDPAARVPRLEILIANSKTDLERLRSPGALKALRDILKTVRAARRQADIRGF